MPEISTWTSIQVMVHVRRIVPRRKECRKVLPFVQLCYCYIILLIGLISKIYQKAAGNCIFIYPKLIKYFPFNKIPSESKYHSNPMWGTLENWKLLLALFMAVVIG